MRIPKPWFRKSERAWYVQLGKKQYRLGTDSKQAKKRFKELLALDLGPAESSSRVYTVRTLCKLFLRRSRKVHAPDTRKWYLLFLKSFCRLFGCRKVHQLKPLNL